MHTRSKSNPVQPGEAGSQGDSKISLFPDVVLVLVAK
jgi:hypothetical protein